MSVTSTARTEWDGGLADGSGTTAFGSGAATLPVNWTARAEGAEATTTPEELLAAAHASCYAMALSHGLGENGTPPGKLEVEAAVTFVPGTGVTTSVLTVSASIDGMDAETFQKFATDAKENCPVSKALAGVEIRLASAELL